MEQILRRITKEDKTGYQNHSSPIVYKGEIKELKIIRDEYILEVFVNGGEEIYSVLL